MLRLCPGASFHPVAEIGCFGSAAIAGQIVWFSRFTIVSVRHPAGATRELVAASLGAPDAVCVAPTL